MVKVFLKKRNIEKALIRRNLTKKELAVQVGVSRCYFSRLLAGEREPSPAVRQRLMDYFKGYTFKYLFNIVED